MTEELVMSVACRFLGADGTSDESRYRVYQQVKENKTQLYIMRKYYKFIRFNGKLKYLGFEMKLFL